MSVQGIRKRQDITAVNIKAVSSIDSSEAERILSGYIDNRIDDSVTQQLRRIQRDLRGLPPLLRNSTTGEVVGEDNGENAVTKTVAMDVDNRDMSKEDKKKLKKERRKQEKKLKAEKRRKENGKDESERGEVRLMNR